MPKLFPILILPALLFAPGLALAQSATISVSLDRGAYQVNDTLMVSVWLAAPEPVTSIKANVNYDPQRLVFRSVNTTGSAFPYWWDNDSLSSQSAGQVKLQASSPTSGITGTNLHVATIEFQTTGNGLAGILLDPETLVLNSVDENVLDASQAPGGIFSIGAITPSFSSGVFARDLQEGDEGADVKALQQFLNSNSFLVSKTGPGSPGQETLVMPPRPTRVLTACSTTYVSTTTSCPRKTLPPCIPPASLLFPNKVDLTDVSRMLTRWAKTDAEDLAEADINGPNGEPDGAIDLYYANKLMANWTR